MGWKTPLLISTEKTLGTGPRSVHINLLFVYRSEKIIKFIIKWTVAGAKGILLIGKHCKEDSSPFVQEGKQNNMCSIKI